MKEYFVDILHWADGLYYTGVTGNLERRLAQHQTGAIKTCFTYHRRPVTLVFSQAFGAVLEAIQAEKQIKKWSRKKKEALILGDWELLHQLAKCRNGSRHGT